MSWRRFRLGITCMVFVGMAATSAHAQNNNNNNNNNQTPFAVAGVVVDAAGVLKVQTLIDPGWSQTRNRAARLNSSVPTDAARSSELRKISLNRLEAALKERLARGEKPTEEMQFLAGLTRVKYVFFFPETKDIVLAGPAQGWRVDVVGRAIGTDTRAPIVELQDLIVALRAFPPNGQSTSVISCSIDPTKEGLAAMQAFLSRLGTQLNAGGLSQQSRFITQGLRESLGLQTITIRGVSANTHFAQVLVEADYRMKLIGIGLERPGIKLASYVDHASPASVSRNAMQRWFFVPDYACVRVSEDKLGMELVGDGVKLVGADELVTAEGSRVKSNAMDMAGKRFVQGFTAKYPELAARQPVYAQLRNVIDLSVAAAFIQQQDYFGQAAWTLGVFADERAFAVETFNPPKQVESAVTAVVKGSRLMTPIGGGVNIKPQQALSDENMLRDGLGEVQSQREKLSLSDLTPGQWWWD